jgi:nitrite reductase (NADH) small subunit
MSTNWKNIGPLANIPLRGARRLCLKSAGKPVAVFRTGDDEVFALIDIVAGKTVTCPLHSWVIGLEDGEAVAPDQGTARPLSLRIVDGDIFIHLPELVAGDMV